MNLSLWPGHGPMRVGVTFTPATSSSWRGPDSCFDGRSPACTRSSPNFASKFILAKDSWGEQKGRDFRSLVLHPHRHLEPPPVGLQLLCERTHRTTKPETGNTSLTTAVVTYRCTQVNEQPPTNRSRRVPSRWVGQPTTLTPLPSKVQVASSKRTRQKPHLVVTR